MDTDKARALISAIETGSISAAADILGVTPSGISRSIASLEQMVGFPLLLRSKGGVCPTGECEILLPQLHNMLHMEEQLMQNADKIRGVESGSVSVGTAYPMYNQFFSERIVSFRKLHPGITIRLTEGTSSELCDMLNMHKLDLCIVSKRENIPAFQPVVPDRLVMWVPAGHDAARKGVYRAKDMETDNYIQIYPNRETDNSLFLQKYHISPNVCAETSDVYAAYSMVESGLGVALINNTLARRWQGSVEAVELDKDSEIDIGLASPYPDEISPAASAFLKFVEEALAGSGIS